MVTGDVVTSDITWKINQFLWLRFRRAYNFAYDSNFSFSVGCNHSCLQLLIGTKNNNLAISTVVKGCFCCILGYPGANSQGDAEWNVCLFLYLPQFCYTFYFASPQLSAQGLIVGVMQSKTCVCSFIHPDFAAHFTLNHSDY